MKGNIFFIVIFLYSCAMYSQEKINLYIKNIRQKPIENAVVVLDGKSAVTNDKGLVVFSIKKDSCLVVVKHVAFEKYEQTLLIKKSKVYTLLLLDKILDLQEVVITAKEKEGITSTSVIDRAVIDHLQPSSFTDLVSLLPGKSVKQTVLNRSTHLKLREVGAGKNYDISSLGISFLMDGTPINSNANLQETVGMPVSFTPKSITSTDDKRNTIRKGVDMRTIATDAIEKVEIVRGIASVKYGDLSSGLVKIKRVKGVTPWRSRMKSDGFSKLFYLGKGYNFSKPAINLNFGIDYLDAKADPRNSLENFKRYTSSLRFGKKFKYKNPISWDLNLDYTGTVDQEKLDPDVNLIKYDSYKSSYSNFRVSNRININFLDKIIKDISFNSSFSQSYDKIEQTKFIQVESIAAMPINKKAGDFYGVYIEPKYISNLLVDGKPLDVFLDLSSTFLFKLKNIRSNLLAGANFSYSKNNGLGQVYDIKRPPSSSSMRTRPRSFKDIPAMQVLALYLEENLKWSLSSFKFNFQGGIRTNTSLALASKYKVSNRMYIDPRCNFKIDFPKINFNKKLFSVSLSAGYGKQSKLPTLNMLYPQDMYRDYVQLNYYHNNKAYRQVHYRTVIFPQVNYDIIPAINLKKELRLSLNYDYHSLYVTLFNEKMTSGFRQMTDYYSYSHLKYDATGLNHKKIKSAPLVKNLPYKKIPVVTLSSKESNGSAILKKGLEFQYLGKRFKGINTRFTLNGAWLQTKYYNSLPFYRASKETHLNAKENYTLGLYEQEDSSFKESFNASLVADTYLQSLGLSTSFRLDTNWYTLSKEEPLNGTPSHYIDVDGKKHLYTEKDKKDAVLQWLDIKYSPELFKTNRTPFSLRGHLKVSKSFYSYFSIAMYVNNLFEFKQGTYSKDFNVLGIGFSEPYFGMEITFKL